MVNKIRNMHNNKDTQDYKSCYKIKYNLETSSKKYKNIKIKINNYIKNCI